MSARAFPKKPLTRLGKTASTSCETESGRLWSEGSSNIPSAAPALPPTVRDLCAGNSKSKHSEGQLRSNLRPIGLPFVLAEIIEGTIPPYATADFFISAVSYVAIQKLMDGAAQLYVLKHSQDVFAAFSLRNSIALSLCCATFFLLIAHGEGLYGQTTRNSRPRERKVLARTLCSWVFLSMPIAIAAFGRLWPFSVGALGLTAVLDYFSINLFRRWLWTHSIRRSPTRRVQNVLMVGAGRLGRAVADEITKDRWSCQTICGFLDDDEAIAGDVLGRFSDFAKISRQHFIDEVVLAIPNQPDLARRLAQRAKRRQINVALTPDLLGLELHKSESGFSHTAVLVRLHAERSQRATLLVKRIIDIALSSVALGLLIPALLAIALSIRLDSAGPILYCAPRAGKKGRSFICYKFRTMVVNANALRGGLRSKNQRGGPFFKLWDDPRITSVGRRLRRYSLDELPQLWNVLRGDMSLVGPRPHPIDDFERYDLEDLRRLNVTPGLTGLWQVTARSDPSFQRNMELDVEYIQTWSLWMDLKILWRTVSTVLQGSGA